MRLNFCQKLVTMCLLCFCKCIGISVITKHQDTEEELTVAHCCLKEQKETIDKLRVNLSEKEAELVGVEKELEAARQELQKKVS